MTVTKPTADALLNKYEQEKKKRLNKAGLGQYVDVRTEQLKTLDRDPWVNYADPRVQNPPLKDGDTVKLLVAGAGLSSVIFAGRFIEDAGFSGQDTVCVDVAGGWGGTWYYNRYPGVMCDVEGYCYVPFLEETGYQPRHKYSYGHEIRGQIERSADHFGIQGQFCTHVDSQIWDEDRKLWVVTLTRTVGEPSTSTTFTVHAEFVALPNAPFILPKIPKLPGWEELSRHERIRVFHSSRWDYNYTGGSPEQPDLVKLKGKRVAIVGTGATSVQIVPELAKWADQVYVVQRTATHVGHRGQRETDAKTWAGITGERGWQEKRRTNFDSYVSMSPGYGTDLVDDGWTHTPAGSGFLGSNSKTVAPHQVEEHIKEMYAADLERTEHVRNRVGTIVKDKHTAAQLQAWYPSWCKRPSFHDDYLAAFNKPNVTLVDTDGQGLQGFTKAGILVNGIEYEIDVLILATGFTFDPALSPSEKMGAVIKGRNGLDMKDYWTTPGRGNLFGTIMPYFPNLFSYFGQGAPATWNLTSAIEMVAHVATGIVKQASKHAKPGERVVVEPTEEAERQYAQEVAKRATWYAVLPTCTPSYFTAEGTATPESQPKDDHGRFLEGKKAPWGGGPVDYKEMTQDWLEKGELVALKIDIVAEN